MSTVSTDSSNSSTGPVNGLAKSVGGWQERVKLTDLVLGRFHPDWRMLPVSLHYHTDPLLRPIETSSFAMTGINHPPPPQNIQAPTQKKGIGRACRNKRLSLLTLLVLGQDVPARRKHVVSHGDSRRSRKRYPLSCIFPNLLYLCIASFHLTATVVVYAIFELYNEIRPVPATVMRLSAEQNNQKACLVPCKVQ